MEQTTLYIIVIIILFALLVLSILGTGIIINIFDTSLSVLTVLIDFILDFFGSLSKNTGDLVIGTGEAVTNTSIFGIEIVDGIINDIGNMFKGQATPVSLDNNHLDIIIQTRDGNNKQNSTPEPTPSTTITGEGKWCYVGKNNDGTNTCVKLQTNQLCQSNKVYNNQNECKSQSG